METVLNKGTNNSPKDELKNMKIESPAKWLLIDSKKIN